MFVLGLGVLWKVTSWPIAIIDWFGRGLFRVLYRLFPGMLRWHASQFSKQARQERGLMPAPSNRDDDLEVTAFVATARGSGTGEQLPRRVDGSVDWGQLLYGHFQNTRRDAALASERAHELRLLKMQQASMRDRYAQQDRTESRNDARRRDSQRVREQMMELLKGKSSS